VKVVPTDLPGVVIVEPTVYRDARGFFRESYNAKHFAASGLPVAFLQDNHSRSTSRVLRGLHYQLHHPQGKLVSCVHGEIFDVAVDIRLGSPTWGRWTGVTLRGEEPRSLWIPPGFAHGFCVLSESADVVYKCTELFRPEDERGVLWSDATIGVRWPVAEPLLSSKDERLAPLTADRGDLPAYIE